MFDFLFKKNKKNEPFAVMDKDFERFCLYYLPDDWRAYVFLKRQRSSLAAVEKKWLELREALAKKRPDFHAAIEKDFLKRYFNG